MFELVANNEIVTGIIDVGMDIINQRKIQRSYNFDDENRKRQLTVESDINLKKKIIDIVLHYRSEPSSK